VVNDVNDAARGIRCKKRRTFAHFGRILDIRRAFLLWARSSSATEEWPDERHCHAMVMAA
jgi:hypothetical protein